ncbi:MAG: AI-2E family transporter [Anaerolineales bacterium]|jgi:predicted PurR-regulated permease PerM
MDDNQPPASPRWGATAKLVITLTLVAILGALLVRFKFILGPILLAFILAYLLLPVASLVNKRTPLSWGMSVNLIYLIFVLILLALLTWGGVGLVGQVTNLISAVQNYANQVPIFIDSLSHQIYTLGPLKFDFSTIDWQAIGQVILSYIEPALGQLGGLVGTLATSAASTLAWMAFIVVVSYFFLMESGGFRTRIIHVDIPGYTEDIRRLRQKLGYIWNAFLRGQIIVFFSKVIAYTICMSILGVHFAIGVALIAGFASFLPYIGPAINWIVLGLVTYFQGSTPFGLSPLGYTAIAIITALVIDQVFDNLVTPRMMANTLKVHPAFVLIAAIIAANLIGILGIIIAAPLLATMQLVGRYTLRKLLDRDPWPPEEDIIPTRRVPKWIREIRTWWQKRFGKEPKPSKVTIQNLKDTKNGK